VRVLLALVFLAGAARAATVRGLVSLPPDARATERDGHWRIDNGVLPVGPRVPDPRADVVVTLEGGPAREPKKDEKAASLQITLHGLRMDPRVVIVAPGTQITFKNDDRLPHTLYLENAQSLMPPEPTPSGTTRQLKLLAAGEYQVRDQEFPHIEGTILVTEAYSAQADERGQFKLDVPEGRYICKVWFHGAWVQQMPVEVGPRTTELKLDVPSPTRKGP
jgi:plastocyanin